MKRTFFATILLICCAPALAAVDCAALPEWSAPKQGYSVNLHHIFCPVAGKRGRAKGFHSMPGGEPPNGYKSAKVADPVNRAGIYTLREIRFSISDKLYLKTFSSMFPDSCNQDQVIESIIYSRLNHGGRCDNPGWAMCGPNAPAQGGERYCLADDGSPYTIATGVLRSDKSRINTGFPIYK